MMHRTGLDQQARKIRAHGGWASLNLGMDAAINWPESSIQRCGLSGVWNVRTRLVWYVRRRTYACAMECMSVNGSSSLLPAPCEMLPVQSGLALTRVNQSPP